VTRVLVVEDEESISDPLSYLLRQEGFEVAVAATGPDGLAEFDRGGADIVLLDLMLPGLSGTEVCRTLRSKSSVPVIMLTARDSEIDKVVGLELGADDYVTKPFSSRELVARVRAVLRRRGGEVEEAETGALEAGPGADGRRAAHRHRRRGAVPMPLKEFELLELLLRNAGRVLTRGQLIDRVWGATTSATPRRSTSTSSGCAPRSSRSRASRSTSSPCAGWATSSRPDRSGSGTCGGSRGCRRPRPRLSTARDGAGARFVLRQGSQVSWPCSDHPCRASRSADLWSTGRPVEKRP
jgi:two-component system response regulator RegX3